MLYKEEYSIIINKVSDLFIQEGIFEVNLRVFQINEAVYSLGEYIFDI